MLLLASFFPPPIYPILLSLSSLILFTTAMAVPTSRFDFQVYGSRDDMLIIPPPGQLRPPRRTTALYMISSPLPSDIEAIRFHITSHDQGWANDPQGPNWTWFAVSVLRPLAEGVGRPIHFEDNECIKSQPGDFGAQFQDSDYYFENIPTEDEDSEDQMSTISIPLVDNQLGLQWQHHSITWSRDDNQNHGGRFIRLLEEGDCIAIWACAEVCTNRRGHSLNLEEHNAY